MRCHRCGTLNFTNIRYCSKCQTEINPTSDYRRVIERPEPVTLSRFWIITILGILAFIFKPNWELNLDDFLPAETLPVVQKSQQATVAPKRTGEEILIQTKARKAYRDVYRNARQHKAFAQAENGAWAYRYNHTTQQNAIDAALKNCRNYSRGQPCKIVNLNDEWYP